MDNHNRYLTLVVFVVINKCIVEIPDYISYAKHVLQKIRLETINLTEVK